MTPKTTGYIPKKILLQWHITERCNLRCAHCYQESYARNHELNFQQLIDIFCQFKTFITALRHQASHRLPAHITVTGGEPFVRTDFLGLLEILASQRQELSFAILTNGTFIDKLMAKHLAILKPAFVQVSIEGTETTHDRVRGIGNFKRTVEAIKHLRKEGIHTIISFTAHRGNFLEFPMVARLGRKLGVQRVWSDRLIPCGSGMQLQEQLLTPEETQTLFRLMSQAHTEAKRAWFKRTEVTLHRALQFLVGYGYPYQCTAGDSLITLQANGDLYPCRRMPIFVGNVLKSPLDYLYQHSHLFKMLRDEQNLNAECRRCFYGRACRGGLRCLSYAVKGNPFHKDPGCWLQHDEKPVENIMTCGDGNGKVQSHQTN